MTNKEVWNIHKEYSQSTSEILRKTAYAGIAFCWLFRDQNSQFPSEVFIAILFLMGFFILDLFQYMLATIMFRCWIRQTEIKVWTETKTIEGDYQMPSWLDVPAFVLFIAKAVALFISFGLLVVWLF